MMRLDCFDEQTVLDLVHGQLAPERRGEAVEHLDACASCRELLAASAKALLPEGDPQGDQDGEPQVNPQGNREGEEPTLPDLRGEPPLQAGASFGRYQILGVVGAGGMGVVYAAYDPQLDRRVALKLVRDGADTHRQRLLREARAIARVAHPNVVAVHEAATVGDRVFIAMEFVDGMTLSAWRPRRTPRERLDVLLQAGRGLAAAHRAGLVHRDFKPDNVLVGKDGRVRVTDFGLARTPGGDDAGAPPQSPVDVTLTRTGAFVGTPAYMAPEQMRGGPVDARADIFSFCVAAWECLFGSRPFSGDTVAALERAISAQQLPEAPDRPLRDALSRGLKARPEERPASMDALLSALEPRQRSRRLALAAAALAVLSAVTFGLQRRSASALCAGADQQLAGVWDAERRTALHTDEHVRSALDDYARLWIAAYTDACQATHVRGEQSAASLDLRMECLHARKSELDAFVTLMPEGGDASLGAHSLRSVEDCSNVAALRQVTRAAQPSLVQPLKAKLARLRARAYLKPSEKVAEEALAASDEARRAGADDVAADALAISGTVLNYRGEYLRASERLQEAAVLASLARDDLRLAHTLNVLTNVAGVHLVRWGEAQRFADYSKEVIRRLDGNLSLERERLGVLAESRWRANDLGGAEADLRRALLLFDRQAVKDPVDQAELLASLANVVADRGDLPGSMQLGERALALYRGSLGHDHPECLRVEMNLANNEYEAGNVEAATARGRRIKAVLDSRPDSDLTDTLENLGWFLLDSNPREARLHLQRALALVQEGAGKDALDLAYPLTALGILDWREGNRDRAVAQLERALELQSEPEQRDSPERAETELALARALSDKVRARSLAEHARRVLVAHPLGARRAALVGELDQLLTRL
jgi:tetratricopeptide (TPR) repeat protein/predicted Ser/Thr protein kinase